MRAYENLGSNASTGYQSRPPSITTYGGSKALVMELDISKFDSM